MNKLILACIGLIAIGTMSCYGERVNGNKNIVTKEIQVSDYNDLKISPSISSSSNGFFLSGKNQSPQINYSQQAGKAGLTITIDENLLPLLNIKSEGRLLSIEVKTDYQINPSKLIIHTHSSELKKLRVSGSIDFFLKSPLSGDNIEIIASGASDVYLEKPVRIANLCKFNQSGSSDLKVDNLECDQIETRSSGSSDLFLTGKANDGKFRCSGSSDIKAYGFTLKNLKCSASGSSDIFITVTESLDASASGSSDIKYKGNPKVNKHSSGASDIKQAN